MDFFKRVTDGGDDLAFVSVRGKRLAQSNPIIFSPEV